MTPSYRHLRDLFGRRVTAGLASLGLVVAAQMSLESRSQNSTAPNSSHADMATAMGVRVDPDGVRFGNEFLPRRTDLPRTLIVPSKQIVELPEDATYDYIEVAGTLKVSRARNTITRFITMVVLPGGTLDVGTQADPVPCNLQVEFIIRDVPLDTAKDPFQWGNGLINFGRQTRVGCHKTAFSESAGAIVAGATTLTLAAPPIGWQVGDELLIPDTAPVTVKPRREATVTIASISDSTLMLSKGLDFAHDNIVDPKGSVVLRPRVANLTRNIVVRSENPRGSRGHTVDIGHGAAWDIRYNQFMGLGRTQNVAHDDTLLADTHVGTNQRGKYTEHHHHAQSSVGGADVGNVYLAAGDPIGKWGLVVHGTSDALIEENIALDFPGAGFVTEDGYEVRNMFRKNLAVGSAGNGVDPNVNADKNCPGCEGTGFWFRGVKNTIEANEGWNNRAGMMLFNQQQPDGSYPRVPGGPADTPFVHGTSATTMPILMTGNVAAANTGNGFEMWATPRFPQDNLVAANNLVQVFAVVSEHVGVWLRNPRVICQLDRREIGVHSSQAYVGDFELMGGEIAGCRIGVYDGGALNLFRVTGTVLQNEVNIDRLPLSATLENVTHVPLANYPHKYILMGDGAVWDGTGPLPRIGVSHWQYQRGSRLVIKNWQGTGQDYLLFYAQSLANSPAWYSGGVEHIFNTPVEGLTMQQSWDKFGLSYDGDVLKESEAIRLDGVINGFARAGLSVTLGPARAVVTYPTMREPAVIEGNYIRIHALLTGDPNAASRVMMVSVDGDHPQEMWDPPGENDDRSFITNHISPGTHEVKVWRTQKGDPKKALEGSTFIAHYCVGSCSEAR